MGRIAIYDVDADDKTHKSELPNLALMRVSAFYKKLGFTVEHYSPLHRDYYDKVFASTIFSFSDKSQLDPEQMEIGGSAWDLHKNLPPEVEACRPDYSLYRYPHSIGFAMRGCRFRCKFCDVPEKEGRPKASNTIGEIWTNRDSNFVVLLDNDFFGNPLWRERIAEVRRLGLDVNFSQGLNIRIITDEQSQALASVPFWNLHHTKRQVHFAWDRFQDEKAIDAGIERVKAAGIKPYQMAFYVLIGFDTTPEQDLYRVTKLKDLGCDPYVMSYDDTDPYQGRFERWVNHKATFYSTSFENYRVGVRGKRDKSTAWMFG